MQVLLRDYQILLRDWFECCAIDRSRNKMEESLLCTNSVQNEKKRLFDVLLTTEDGTQRAGDFIRGEQARRDLVEHASKEMIVPLIDQREAHWSATQNGGCGDPSEAATDNDHAG